MSDKDFTKKKKCTMKLSSPPILFKYCPFEENAEFVTAKTQKEVIAVPTDDGFGGSKMIKKQVLVKRLYFNPPEGPVYQMTESQAKAWYILYSEDTPRAFPVLKTNFHSPNGYKEGWFNRMQEDGVTDDDQSEGERKAQNNGKLPVGNRVKRKIRRKRVIKPKEVRDGSELKH